MKEEYTEYPCNGKKYNNEKAIISLTSWKARINTVSKTLFSLIKQCPGFHIVLVLSEEEFPKKEAELPENLMMFVENDLIEILWVYKNYKSFKKILFTMDKYRDVPVISADDDCIYTCNYANLVYEKWLKNKNCVVKCHPKPHTVYLAVDGHGTLYTYNNFGKYAIPFLQKFDEKTIYLSKDDDFYNAIIKKFNLQYDGAYKNNFYTIHDEIESLTKQSVTTLQENIDYFENKMKEWCNDDHIK